MNWRKSVDLSLVCSDGGLGWACCSVLREPEDVFYWLCLENTAHRQSIEKLLALLCSCPPALETSPLLLRGWYLSIQKWIHVIHTEWILQRMQPKAFGAEKLIAVPAGEGKSCCGSAWDGESCSAPHTWQGTAVSLAQEEGFPLLGCSINGRNVILLRQDGAVVGLHISNGRG